eukprot:gb/GEZN01006782.1/.p1 GENE.gb/GEZN01006782.1/~~gb/GEZN01006782.1/.p1  ORF type:complete len:465 (-),score=51.96 gb/GEZN01006782.1/:151-1545(-)
MENEGNQSVHIKSNMPSSPKTAALSLPAGAMVQQSLFPLRVSIASPPRSVTILGREWPAAESFLRVESLTRSGCSNNVPFEWTFQTKNGVKVSSTAFFFSYSVLKTPDLQHTFQTGSTLKVGKRKIAICGFHVTLSGSSIVEEVESLLYLPSIQRIVAMGLEQLVCSEKPKVRVENTIKKNLSKIEKAFRTYRPELMGIRKSAVMSGRIEQPPAPSPETTSKSEEQAEPAAANGKPIALVEEYEDDPIGNLLAGHVVQIYNSFLLPAHHHGREMSDSLANLSLEPADLGDPSLDPFDAMLEDIDADDPNRQKVLDAIREAEIAKKAAGAKLLLCSPRPTATTHPHQWHPAHHNTKHTRMMSAHTMSSDSLHRRIASETPMGFHNARYIQESKELAAKLTGSPKYDFDLPHVGKGLGKGHRRIRSTPGVFQVPQASGDSRLSDALPPPPADEYDTAEQGVLAADL